MEGNPYEKHCDCRCQPRHRLLLIRELLCEGYNVTVLDIEINNLTSLGGNILPILCDVSDKECVRDSIEKSGARFGSVDCAIQNACMCTFNSMEMTVDEVYHKVFEINYFGALNLARAVLPYMKEKNSGKVFFTSSGVGVMGFVNISPYASTKGAIESLAKCLKIEYADYNISFHIFHTPLTNTQSASSLPVPKEFMANPEAVGKGFARRINKKSFDICHSYSHKLQTQLCYLFPLKMGKLMSKASKAYMNRQDSK